MNNNLLNVQTRVDDIFPSEDDSPNHINITFWLKDNSEVLGFATVRVFFTSEEVSLKDLKTAALSHGPDVIAKISQLYKPDPSPVDLFQPSKE